MSRAICVVPLAGPDLIHPHFGPRPLMEFEGEPLIRRALATRSWAGALAPSDYAFVLRSVDGVKAVQSYLTAAWPGCAVLVLPHVTEGALLSAAAGVCLAPSDAGPVIIDLADILFSGGPDPRTLGEWPKPLGGLVPTFTSSDPAYSYLRCEGGKVVEAVEKRVISQDASAGVYFFRDVAVFMSAVGHSLAHRETVAHDGSLFVCPAMNGVIAGGLEVRIQPVENVRAVSKLFARR